MSVEYKGKKFKVRTYKESSSLDLSNKKIINISDIVGLNQLKDLTSLNLKSNQITEIKGLDHLVNLKSLNLSNNQITEIKGLENLTRLEVLDLMDNKIDELKGLEYLNNLRRFMVYGNPLYDWIQEELGGDYGKAEVAVQYCVRLKGMYQLDANEIETFLETTREEIEDRIKNKSFYEVSKLLLSVYAKLRLDDKTKFYQFFGSILLDHPDLFAGKFHKQYPVITGNLTIKEVFEMETYIIEHYCSYQDEKFFISFPGRINKGRIIIKGRIYVTSLRLFILGRLETKDNIWGPLYMADLADLLFLPVAFASAIKKKWDKDRLRETQDSQIPSFGFQFPLLSGYRTSIRKTSMKIKSLKISPNQIKNENEQDFLKRVDKIFSIIHEVIQGRAE